MIIDIAELQKISDRLFKQLNHIGIQTVELQVDYYWDIPSIQRYNIYAEPDEFTVGQLQSDLQELSKVLSGEREPIPYHLVWLAALLRALGEELIG